VEVCEAIDVLNGKGPDDTRKVTLALGALMLQTAGKAKDLSSGMDQLSTLLDNGAAWEKFLEIVQTQEGDISFLENPDKYPAPKHRREIKAEADGYITAINAREIGRLCMLLGAGRKTVDDAVDYTAGMLLHKKVGEKIERDEPLVTLQTSGPHLDEGFASEVGNCFEIGTELAIAPRLLQKILDAHGVHEVKAMD
jgi:thymidine phosphorylase